MSTESKTVLLLNSLPFANRPGTDLMSKLILQKEKTIDIIIEASIGRDAVGQYLPRPTKWADGTKTDVLYATENSRNLPPVLVEVQYAVDNTFLHRVVRYCEEILAEYGASPVVLIIAIHECRIKIMNKATKAKSKPFLFKLPSYPWADKGYILAKKSISPLMQKSPLDPIVALGSFLIEQKPSLSDHPYKNAPEIKRLYRDTNLIFQNQTMAQKSRISNLSRAIEDAEARFHKVISLLKDDIHDHSTRKRTIDCLNEGITLLRTSKRQHMSNQPPSSTPLSTTPPACDPVDPSPSSSSDPATIDESP